jgi:hypothetical protein
MKRLTTKELLDYYEDGNISYSELVCSLSELPEDEIKKLRPSLKAQAMKVKRMVASGMEGRDC